MSQAEPSDPTALREELRAAAARGMTLAVHARVAPQRPALVSPAGSRTFGSLNARCNQLARALRARGLRAGDGVALLCSNRLEFVEVIYAGARAGLRVTPINFHLTGAEAGYIVENCEAKAFVADARFADVAREAAALAPGAGVRLAVGGAISGFDDYDGALAGGDASFGAPAYPDPSSGGDTEAPARSRSALAEHPAAPGPEPDEPCRNSPPIGRALCRHGAAHDRRTRAAQTAKWTPSGADMKRFKILGRFWRLRFAPNMANRGDCDPPSQRKKEIRISSTLRGEERLEVLLHELLHAAGWHIDEAFVSPLIVGYPPLVAASGLWFRVTLVWFTTAIAALSFAVLMALNWPSVVDAHKYIMFLVVVVVLGFIVAYQVHRVRALSRFYERRPLP